jgi:peptidoglycan/xylan/chitin deacetylase (PgdA/CDA1 family)
VDPVVSAAVQSRRARERSAAVRRFRLPVVLLVAAAALLGLVPPAAAERPATVVSLTFDDGSTDHHTTVRPVLERHRMAGTFYLNSDRLGRTGYLTERQVRELAAAGHEIGGHTLSHARLTEAGAAEARRQICDDRKRLTGLGLTVTTFAYPYGAASADLEKQVAACGYEAARDVGGLVSPGTCDGCAYAETFPPRDGYAIRTPDSADEDTTLAVLKGYVTQAERHGGGWVPIVFHHVCDPCSGGNGRLAVAPDVLEDFTAWLAKRAARGTRVATVADALASAGHR